MKRATHRRVPYETVFVRLGELAHALCVLVTARTLNEERRLVLRVQDRQAALNEAVATVLSGAT